jgi:hypothetical protein
MKHQPAYLTCGGPEATVLVVYTVVYTAPVYAGTRQNSLLVYEPTELARRARGA